MQFPRNLPQNLFATADCMMKHTNSRKATVNRPP